MKENYPVRVVTRAAHGELRIRDYPTTKQLLRTHTQIGVDDCSLSLSLRGLPVFRELVGPIPEGDKVAQYESPEVFEMLTLEWSTRRICARRRQQQLPNCSWPELLA